ncbi:hypothetical protein EVAR_10249_1 [Eumeta japonica]|uniref:Integrase catalytic domain-containing protein n=1 Tax=Eumeta variegata TaxID=151549 RepID=A0A4C1TEF1_EUMVA|nr:hypothetical protein EVAR_10249_1 [Eumeta japonica]
MYRQIEVNESQRPLQQILWRFDPSKPLKSYTLNTVTYGTASAPFLATRWVTCDSAKYTQIHIFTDASEKAYGACAYIRTVTHDSVEVHLLAAKSKVAPLKPMTMPRLELCAALLGTRLYTKIKKSMTMNYSYLRNSELENSKNILLKSSQHESFGEEYQLLKQNKRLPYKNRLLSLSPFIDAEGLLRVGGRLKNSFYDYDVKHPVLLSGKHRLTRLIFTKYHIQLLHAGPQLLLATIRQKYWPLNGRNLAKNITNSCIKCCRIKGETIQPIMGHLPAERTNLEFPFFDTGVDYAGPIMIADRKGRGCKLIKTYISVFVCLATRAVHLELVSDLTKEAFISALNRFMARRGKPRNIFSDNGTSFVGAFNELSNILKQDFSSHFTEGINFSFIPAYTPHFGGLWESAVKSIKYHLRRVLGLTHLTYDEMCTCLTQIEAILNSRPLTPLSIDTSDLTPLTPAHFLIGRSLTSLNGMQRGELTNGTMVLIKDSHAPPLMWLLGRIVRIIPGTDGIARVADIQTKKGIALQSKGLSVDQVAIKIEALRLFDEEKRMHLAEEAIDFTVQKSEEYNIPIEQRIRRKKRMPGKLASSTDDELTLRAQINKDML